MHPWRLALVALIGFVFISPGALASSKSTKKAKVYRKAARASFLIGEDFRGLDLRGVVFFSANLRKANFSRSKLGNASFEGSELVRSLFKKSKARGASFEGANLTRADFRGADLRGADMARANLRGARLQGAKLGKVVWESTICPDGSNSDAHHNTCVGHLFPAGPKS